MGKIHGILNGFSSTHKDIKAIATIIRTPRDTDPFSSQVLANNPDLQMPSTPQRMPTSEPEKHPEIDPDFSRDSVPVSSGIQKPYTEPASTGTRIKDDGKHPEDKKLPSLPGADLPISVGGGLMAGGIGGLIVDYGIGGNPIIRSTAALASLAGAYLLFAKFNRPHPSLEDDAKKVEEGIKNGDYTSAMAAFPVAIATGAEWIWDKFRG